ncbi:MAG: nitronate monooxygenase [Silvibacterium sp.]|nr:nitronate monooxygenase [Silvibacterium sp.]
MSRSPSLHPLARVEAFTARVGIRLPILLAPMAGACPPSLSIAVANAGGMGACGAALMPPDSIASWAKNFRAQSSGQFQINLWTPDPPPLRDAEAEKRQREFLARWGPSVSPEMGDSVLPDFEALCRAAVAARPKAISSIMGLFASEYVGELKEKGILWLATATTVEEARAAEAAGADAVIAQGMEAGGHRGAFRAEDAESHMVGLMALLPQIADAVSIPVIAAGAIADGRAVAATLILGASAVLIGTAFLRSPEAQLNAACAERLGRTDSHQTALTRAFTGRLARGIRNRFIDAAAAPDAPPAAPYSVQRGYTRPMREEATRSGDTDRMQMWAGQAARLAQAQPAAEIVQRIWSEARQFLQS